MSKLSYYLSKISLYFSAAGLTGITLIIGYQVFARYALNAAPSWTEQAALFLMLWFIFFAAAAGVREGFHIRLSLLQEVSPPSIKKILLLSSHMIVGLFGIVMVVGGVQLVNLTWSHRIPVIGLPRGSAYIPFVISGALIVFFSAEHLVAVIRNKDVKSTWN